MQRSGPRRLEEALFAACTTPPEELGAEVDDEGRVVDDADGVRAGRQAAAAIEDAWYVHAQAATPGAQWFKRQWHRLRRKTWPGDEAGTWSNRAASNKARTLPDDYSRQLETGSCRWTRLEKLEDSGRACRGSG